MGHAYLRSDQSTAEAVTRTLAAREPDVESEEVVFVDAPAFEEEDQPLGWLISLLVEQNARDE